MRFYPALHFCSVRGEVSDQQVIMLLLSLTSMEENGVDGLLGAAPTHVKRKL